MREPVENKMKILLILNSPSSFTMMVPENGDE